MYRTLTHGAEVEDFAQKYSVTWAESMDCGTWFSTSGCALSLDDSLYCCLLPGSRWVRWSWFDIQSRIWYDVIGNVI